MADDAAQLLGVPLLELRRVGPTPRMRRTASGVAAVMETAAVSTSMAWMAHAEGPKALFDHAVGRLRSIPA
ncbi:MULTISPECIES: hypothetical protein [Thermomonosporaceae]|uniref:hypothetical protein n=1 Tax=Thermomonosporaceae TaxID=2012 RepID=UPI00255AE0B9|nr:MULTISPECIES: hypothetical protein [Thermomonosporaceae]MDL4775702.1 hypothetical protein [Actinomadura xylanilytica]